MVGYYIPRGGTTQAGKIGEHNLHTLDNRIWFFPKGASSMVCGIFGNTSKLHIIFGGFSWYKYVVSVLLERE